MSRETRLAARRERKFERHAISIDEEKITEERKNQTVHFKFAVRAGQKIIARATTRRYALKAAHNYISRLGG